MKLKLNCITVPVYKPYENLSDNEKASLTQLGKVLGGHPISLFGGKYQPFEKYINHLLGCGARSVWIEKFDDNFLASITGYNSLLMSLKFYKRYKQFNYILIYQLDAWVFRDELDYWCDKGYDYIGAPWFEGLHKPTGFKIIGVGNGGLSLRRVSAHLKLLRQVNTIIALEKYRLFNLKGVLPRITQLVKDVCAAWKMKSVNFNPEIFEDMFFCVYAKEKLENFTTENPLIRFIYKKFLNYDFRIASIEDSIKFSFEVNPGLLYSMNENQLPFGCHAWEKYEPVFWKRFIQQKRFKVFPPTEPGKNA